MEALAGSGEWRRSSRSLDGEREPDRCQLVGGWFASSCLEISITMLSGLNIRILDFLICSSRMVPGSDGSVQPALVARRTLHRGDFAGQHNPEAASTSRPRPGRDWLLESAGTVSYPVWSADSKYLYFDDILVNGDESICRAKVGR